MYINAYQWGHKNKHWSEWATFEEYWYQLKYKAPLISFSLAEDFCGLELINSDISVAKHVFVSRIKSLTRIMQSISDMIMMAW